MCLCCRLQHEQHGTRHSTFFSGKTPSLRAQQRQRRTEAAAVVVSATALRPQREAQAADAAEQSGAAASAAAALQPPRQTATVPDERRDQRLRDRELRSVESHLVAKTVTAHAGSAHAITEQHQAQPALCLLMHQQCVTAASIKQCSTLYRQSRGGKEAEEYALRQCVQLHEQRPANAPLKRNARWEGGVLDDAYRWGPAQQPSKPCSSLPLVAHRSTCTPRQHCRIHRPAGHCTAMH